MPFLHLKVLLKHSEWMIDVTQVALQQSIEVIDWMVAVQNVCRHPCICLADSPLQMPALYFFAKC